MHTARTYAIKMHSLCICKYDNRECQTAQSMQDRRGNRTAHEPHARYLHVLYRLIQSFQHLIGVLRDSNRDRVALGQLAVHGKCIHHALGSHAELIVTNDKQLHVRAEEERSTQVDAHSFHNALDETAPKLYLLFHMDDAASQTSEVIDLWRQRDDCAIQILIRIKHMLPNLKQKSHLVKQRTFSTSSEYSSGTFDLPSEMAIGSCGKHVSY